ncbi:MAG: universal stress protein [Anaerolineales bacterium]
MFTNILVPLDGSRFAERALEPAIQMAQKFDATILLVRVFTPELEPIAAGMSLRYPELSSIHERNECELAESYLRSIRAQWLGMEVPMATRVMTGSAPEMIQEAAMQAGTDLIVMSTHGRSGFSRLLYGSVAEAVLRGTHLPVLLIPIK